MSLRRQDVEQWMRHRCLPEELRRYLFSLFCSHSYCHQVFGVKFIKAVAPKHLLDSVNIRCLSSLTVYKICCCITHQEKFKRATIA